jgi:transcriptional regulator with XRE-family HTH domain
VGKVVLEKILEKKNISKRQFAKRLGLDYSNVFRFFRPDYDPKFSTLVSWAKVLEVKIRDLFEE